MRADSSLKAKMVFSLMTSMRISSECTTAYPSKRNKSRTMGASSKGQLYRQMVTQYCAKMPRSHSSCQINRNIFGTFSSMSLRKKLSILPKPERSFSKSYAHPFHRITPTSTQNTRYENSSSMMAWPLNSWSFYKASSRNSIPPIRFMPCVYPRPLSRAQAMSIFLNSGRYFVMASVLRTSLSMMSSQPAGSPYGSASFQKESEVALRIYWVFASTSHTSLRMRQSMPLKTEKQRSFLECVERSQVRITSAHSSNVSARPSQRLPIRRKSLIYIFSTPSCSPSAQPSKMKSSLGFSYRMSSMISSKLFERSLVAGQEMEGCSAGTLKYVFICRKRFINILIYKSGMFNKHSLVGRT